MVYSIESNGFSAKFDSYGARLISLKDREGLEYIWQRDARYWSDCAPILFPVIARTRDGKITANGKEYRMPKHGLLRNAEFKVAEQKPEAITFMSAANEETKEAYPWNYVFYVTFSLCDNQLTTAFRVENKDESQMYFCLGAHPAFNVPLTNEEAFEDWRLVFEKEEVLYSNHTNEDESTSAKKDLILAAGNNLPLRRTLFDNDAMIFEEIGSKKVELIGKSGRGVSFAYEDFPNLAIWTKGEPSDAPYVCLEPWFGMGFRDDEGYAIEEKYGVLKLEPQKDFTASFMITML